MSRNITTTYIYEGGSGSGGDKHYTHDQPLPNTTWVVVHNLGTYPSVTIVDTANTEIVGDVEYNNNNQITITFTSSVSGKAYLN